MEVIVMLQRSLESIIKEVLKENGAENEANVRKYRRYFYKLIEDLGGDIEVLRKGNRTISFDENEVDIIKIIINQLYSVDKSSLKGLFNGGDEFTPVIVHKFLDSLINNPNLSDISEDERMRLIQFFSDIFLLSDKRMIEECHLMIDKIAQQALVYNRVQRLTMLSHLQEYLKRYVFFILTDGTIKIAETAKSIEILKNRKNKSDCLYDFLPPIFQSEYIIRDEYILDMIQKDNDLREYIEKKIGKKAEEVFNYTVLNDIAPTTKTDDISE